MHNGNSVNVTVTEMRLIASESSSFPLQSPFESYCGLLNTAVWFISLIMRSFLDFRHRSLVARSLGMYTYTSLPPPPQAGVTWIILVLQTVPPTKKNVAKYIKVIRQSIFIPQSQSQKTTVKINLFLVTRD